jgi:hypothetical protein
MFRPYILAIVREFQVWSACTAYMDWIYDLDIWTGYMDWIYGLDIWQKDAAVLSKNINSLCFYSKYRHAVRLDGSETCNCYKYGMTRTRNRENNLRRAYKRGGVQREGKNRDMPYSAAFWMPEAAWGTIIESLNKLRALFTEERRRAVRLNGMIFEKALLR